MMRKALFVILSLFVLGVIASLHAPQARAQIYVGNSFGNNIPTFPNNANGDIVPTTNIQGFATTLETPADVAVDSNFIYVANFFNNSIDVFPLVATGDVAPARSIQGGATTLDGPEGVAVGALQPPCVDIEKLVSVDGGTTFVDADDCAAAPVTEIDAEYKLVVTNCGSLTLNNVTVTDPDLGINLNIGPLAPGESRMDTIPAPGICPGGPEIVNTATVPTDEGVTDSDSTCVRCIPQQVPAMTGWGISVLALGLLGSALRVMQKRDRM